jgi:hypothetical protein
MRRAGRGGGDRKHYRTELQGLRSNAGERKGILIGPSMAPRFFLGTEIPTLCFFSLHESRRRPGLNFVARMASRRPTFSLFSLHAEDDDPMRAVPRGADGGP